MEIKISEEQLKALIDQLKGRNNRPADPQSVSVKELVVIKKFEGETPKACREEDLIETIYMEFQDGVLSDCQVVKPQEEKG